MILKYSFMHMFPKSQATMMTINWFYSDPSMVTPYSLQIVAPKIKIKLKQHCDLENNFVSQLYKENRY